MSGSIHTRKRICIIIIIIIYKYVTITFFLDVYYAVEKIVPRMNAFVMAAELYCLWSFQVWKVSKWKKYGVLILKALVGSSNSFIFLLLVLRYGILLIDIESNIAFWIKYHVIILTTTPFLIKYLS